MKFVTGAAYQGTFYGSVRPQNRLDLVDIVGILRTGTGTAARNRLANRDSSSSSSPESVVDSVDITSRALSAVNGTRQLTAST